MTRLLLAVAFAILQGAGSAGAQLYPSRQITIVVPAVAGGSTDAIARVVALRMQAALGPPVVVENVAGAGGAIGTARVARAAPDGYTLGVGNWNSRVSAGVVYPAQYDALKDFEPIALLTNAPIWIVARPTLPATGAHELIAWLKANPGKATAGFVGAGTASHLCGIHFQNTTGTRFQFAPYRSGAPAYSDLVAGHIDLMCAEGSATVPHVRGGKLKAYAVLAKSRWFGAPDVPSVDEVGLPGLYMSFWQGLWAPGAPRKTSLPGSMPLSSTPFPIRRCASGSPTRGWKSRRASCRRRKVLAHFTAPKSSGGGRSSRRPTSSRIDWEPMR